MTWKKGLVCCLGLGLAAGLLPLMGACSLSSYRAVNVDGEYVNYPQAMRLVLDDRDRSLLMTQGLEILSSGRYYVKWQRLYCSRDNRAIVIGRIDGDRIVTEVGDFVKQN